ncbi:MAG: rRNA maturation RNase YbeY [Bryobacteraceae bacterium]
MSAGGSTLLFGALPAQSRFSAEEKRALKQFARALANRVAGGRNFTCFITNDEQLRKLNKAFLHHDYATDVLSFPLETEPGAPETGPLGEIAISAERAEAQARGFAHPRLDEIRILMLHGVLHLIGMDHERDHGEMKRAERNWRIELALPQTLLARAPASRAAR